MQETPAALHSMSLGAQPPPQPVNTPGTLRGACCKSHITSPAFCHGDSLQIASFPLSFQAAQDQAGLSVLKKTLMLVFKVPTA